MEKNSENNNLPSSSNSHISHILSSIFRSKLVENYSKPSVANFGRSLFGGYCPTYVPDFVLHGIPSDEKLRQSLTAELSHAVQVRDRSVWTFASAIC